MSYASVEFIKNNVDNLNKIAIENVVDQSKEETSESINVVNNQLDNIKLITDFQEKVLLLKLIYIKRLLSNLFFVIVSS